MDVEEGKGFFRLSGVIAVFMHHEMEYRDLLGQFNLK